MNFLESLAAEWYAIQGYFVRTNIKANRRYNGGYNNEIDVLAFLPGLGKLVHLETSWDALTWEKREERYLSKKFIFTLEQYTEILGVTPVSIQKRAIIGTSKRCLSTYLSGLLYFPKRLFVSQHSPFDLGLIPLHLQVANYASDHSNVLD